MPKDRTDLSIIDENPKRERFGRVALILMLAIVVARATMLEIYRDPQPAAPGTAIPPRAPGADTSLLLDWISFLPAVLVCLRAIMGREQLRGSLAAAAFALLGTWALVSVLWASDRFASVINAFHVFSAAAMFWAAIQLVRDWVSLRLIAGVSVGLLGVMVVHGAMYKYIDAPELQRNWDQQREEILRQRGLDPDSYSARQLERKILAGEVPGFAASTNTYGAELVLLLLVLIGVGVQRYKDRAGIGWWLVLLAIVAPTLLMIRVTDSRTAMATPLLGIFMYVVISFLAPFRSGRRKLLYWMAVFVTLLSMAALVGHGLYHGTLFHDSLTFRWRYWVGAWQIFTDHKWIGVGWNEFGHYYLGTRLPIAAEEIKDPHNLFVRVFVELGIIGGTLAILWVLRLGWEAGVRVKDTANEQPAVLPAEPSEAKGEGLQQQIDLRALSTLFLVGLFGIFVNILSTFDFSQSASYNGFEMMKRTLYLCVFVIGGAMVIVDPRNLSRVDDRPGIWLVRWMVIAAAVFLVHNLIDFSLWENGPGLIFLTIIGAAIGIYRPDPKRVSRVLPLSLGTMTVLVMIVSFIALIAPVMEGEAHGRDGDDFVRKSDFASAIREYTSAAQAVPYNAEYAFRQAHALLGAGSVERGRAALDRAIQLDPMSVQYRLTRADYVRRSVTPDRPLVLADLRQVVRLNPNDVQTRISLGDALAQFGQKPEAREAYEEALRYNDLLHPDEPKRLTPSQLQKVQKQIDSLR